MSVLELLVKSLQQSNFYKGYFTASCCVFLIEDVVSKISM